MPATVLGGFFPTNGVNTLSTAHNMNSAKRRVAQMLDQKGMLATRAAMAALNGVVPGSAAVKTYGRVAAAVELGGLRTIESETLINRNTTAADVTDITADMLTFTTRTSKNPPVVNLDGNPLGTR